MAHLDAIGSGNAEAGVNLEYVYGSGIDRVPMVAVVIGVPDAQRASAATGI